RSVGCFSSIQHVIEHVDNLLMDIGRQCVAMNIKHVPAPFTVARQYAVFKYPEVMGFATAKSNASVEFECGIQNLLCFRSRNQAIPGHAKSKRCSGTLQIPGNGFSGS